MSLCCKSRPSFKMTPPSATCHGVFVSCRQGPDRYGNQETNGPLESKLGTGVGAVGVSQEASPTSTISKLRALGPHVTKPCGTAIFRTSYLPQMHMPKPVVTALQRQERLKVRGSDVRSKYPSVILGGQKHIKTRRSSLARTQCYPYTCRPSFLEFSAPFPSSPCLWDR